MKIKCVIIDDEPLAIKVIENHLKEFQNFEVIGTFNDPITPLALLENTKTNVVITTAYREYAVESYDLNVLDYLVKPIPFNRFLKTINKITQKVYQQKGIQKEEDTSNESFIFLKVDKKLVKIKFDAILYIESLKDYIKVRTTTENYLVHKSLTSITEELPDTNFIRIHRSYTIAIDKVKSLEGNLLEIGIARIPIGRKYVSHAKRIILNTDEYKG